MSVPSALRAPAPVNQGVRPQKTMKWREPWRNTLRRQDPLRIFTRPVFVSVVVWTAVVLVAASLKAIASGTSLSEIASRAWMVVPLGVALGVLYHVIQWVSPLKVSSGPRGIVREKGQSLALIPWEAIRSYRIYPLAEELVLELSLISGSTPELLYMPHNANVTAIEQELRSNVRAEV